MATLWLKFPDEVLSSHYFTESEQQKLNTVFASDNPQSPWRQALTLLSLSGEQVQMIKWVSGCPYFNWSEMTRLSSGGIIAPIKTQDGSYTFQSQYTLRNLGRLLATQWKITRYLTRPSTASIGVTESLALGIVLQCLIIRLGGDMNKVAASLASIANAKPQERKILEQIQSVQMRRTAISLVWDDFLPAQNGEASVSTLPDFFWDDDIPSHPTHILGTNSPQQDYWKAMAVCGGKIKGLAVAIGRSDTVETLSALKAQYNAPLILVFRNARPQSVEFFPHADALLFAEGGALSHACTVAREMNIPTITALGPAFLAQIENNPKTWLSMDGQAGTVATIKD